MCNTSGGSYSGDKNRDLKDITSELAFILIERFFSRGVLPPPLIFFKIRGWNSVGEKHAVYIISGNTKLRENDYSRLFENSVLHYFVE